MKKLKKILPFVIPPLGVLAIMMFVYWKAGMYPFGSGTISWCDMNQQVIPLLIDFKDVLDGKTSLFFNLNNAGGMNLYGVFFFFLASPFSFLVKFVDKGDMITFVNVLLVLKMMMAALTSVIYFRVCKKDFNPYFAVILSLMYAFCGYGMLFYQNIIWLDMMYLFPLLMIALQSLIKKQNNIPYIIMLTAMMVVNYYISYMVVVFILVLMGIYICYYAKCEKTSLVCVKFLSGSIISALLSAVVWIPCFMQFLTSGRGESITVTLANSDLITNYKTIFPLLYCTAFIFVVVGYRILSNGKRSRKTSAMLLMFALMLIPFVLEPINIMWHTGTYMSFPTRYGFITIFIGLICVAEFIEIKDNDVRKTTATTQLMGVVIAAFLMFIYITFSRKFIDENFKALTHYTASLWGDDGSFEGLTVLFFVTLIIYSAIYILYRRGVFSKHIFASIILVIFVFEAVGNTQIYMTSANSRDKMKAKNMSYITDLADRIDDDDFYRVGTTSKIMDYNMVGALGYPSLSHYTSLTDEQFMFTQKRLGYTSVWMEVGSAGGTELTDALYCVKYKITPDINVDDFVYQNDKYSIIEQENILGLGIITDADLSNAEDIPAGYTRAEIQQYIYETLYGTNQKLITEYEHSESESSGYTITNGRHVLKDGATITYRIDVKGRQSLYADCFDRLSNDLSEKYFNSLSISVNGLPFAMEYPKTTENGVLKLGEFEDETVEITIDCSKAINCYSFGVFGLDLDVLENSLNSTETANLKAGAGDVHGSFYSDKAQKCVVTIPYEDGFTVKVNGEKVKYEQVLSDFISFDVAEGENDIEITFMPKGFYIGLVLTVIGIAAFVLYILKRKKFKITLKLEENSQMVLCFISVLVIGLIYVMPLIIMLTSY